MAYRTQAEALTAHATLAEYIAESQSGAPQLVNGISNYSISSGGFLSVQFADDDYFSALSLPITYSFQWDGGALPNWLTYDAANSKLSGQSPTGALGSFTVRRTASVVNGAQTYTSYDEFTVVISSTAPIVIAQPQARTFSEGVQTTFQVDIASFFSVQAGGAAPVYEIFNSDGTNLTTQGWTINSLVNGLASITSPATGSGVDNKIFKVTDNLGRTAQVTAVYTINANPLPIVINTPPSGSFDISQSGNFPIDASTIFSDTEALTYALFLSDGNPAPAGYSWDGVNLAFPSEAGATTRSFILRATEAGALARSVDSASFTIARTASPVVIVTASDVSWPENATTVRRIDVRAILGTDDNEDITIPAGLSGQISKASVGSGVFDLTGVFADNQILSGVATYSGTISGSPVQAAPTFSSAHNPPVIPVLDIDALADGNPVAVDVVAASDDANNLIEAGSVSSNIGTAVLSADFKSITVDLSGNVPGTATISYTMTAPDGTQPTAGSLTVNFLPIEAPQIISSIASTSTDGTAFPAFSVKSYWSAGSYPIDWASAQFFNAQTGSAIGKSQIITGVGQFIIDNNGSVSFTAVSGWVGTVNVYIGVSDINGNPSAINTWAHTQQAKATVPPPPDPNAIFPNISDGLPIVVRGHEPAQHWTAGYMMWKNKVYCYRGEPGAAGSNSNWSTNLYDAKQKIERGEWDPATGILTLAAGETVQFRTPRFIQLSAEGSHTNIHQGPWEWTMEVVSGSPSVSPGAGWATDPSPPAGYKRYTKTLDNNANGSENFNVSGPGDIRLHYVGLVSDASDWQTSPVRADYLADMAMDKVHRFMDTLETNSSMMTRADEWIRDGEYLKFGVYSYTGTLASNHSKVRGGGDIKMLAEIMVSIGRALWLNVPGGFGGAVTEGDPLGWFGARDSAGLMSYWPQIFAAAKIEYRKLAQRWVQSLIDASYPDNFIVALEFSNETWNSTFRINKYMRALQDYLISVGHNVKNVRGGGGAGYMCHLMAKEFAQVISEMKPNQQVRFIIGAQTATPPTEFSDGALRGWDAYAADNPSGFLPRSQLYFGTTGYLSDAHKWSNNPGIYNPFGATSEAEWALAYSQAWQAGTSTLYAKIDPWFVDPALNAPRKCSSVYGALADNIAHASWCEANGVGWIGQYEGSYHENLPNREIIQTAGYMTAAQRRNVIRNWINSAGGYAAQKLFLQEMFANYPNAWCANYYKYHSSGHPGNPWYEKNFNNLGSTVPNTASAAWEEFATTIGAAPPAPPPSTPTLYSEDFSTNNTIPLLQADGWAIASGYSVISDGGSNVLYHATDQKEAERSFRNALQANANLVLRLKFKAQLANRICQIRDTGNAAHVAIRPTGDGNITISALQTNPTTVLVTTTGLNSNAAYVDLEITYLLDGVNGTVEVRDAVSSTVYGSFTGNTNPQGFTNPHLSMIAWRGGSYLSEIEDMTP